LYVSASSVFAVGRRCCSENGNVGVSESSADAALLLPAPSTERTTQ